MQPIFDGHNDALLRLWLAAKRGLDPVSQFVDGSKEGHLDLPKAKTGGLIGGLCAIFVPSPEGRAQQEYDPQPMALPLPRNEALDAALEFTAIARRIQRAGGWRLCESGSDIQAAINADQFAAVLHMEGVEALDVELDSLEVFHAAGMRSLGPVWSRHNAFGHGVPFAFNQSPDTGPGLTDAGKRLVSACDELGIMLDLAHLNEAGFWDVARHSQAPLVASHSNAHALTPVARNLTDRQLDAIRERGGLVGLNYACNMLRSDGRHDANTPLDDMRRHLDYLIERTGVECVGLGSDFDGALIPSGIGDAAGLQQLVKHLAGHGYDDATLAKLCMNNWISVLKRCWKET